MAVRDILLDTSGNRLLAGADYAVADGLQAVAQGIQTRLRLWKGEYWLDQNQGVDWQGRILIRNPNPLVVKTELQAAIAATPDVTKVSEVAFQFTSSNRSATATYNASSPYGNVPGSVTQ